jgi:hypothetical protein
MPGDIFKLILKFLERTVPELRNFNRSWLTVNWINFVIGQTIH